MKIITESWRYDGIPPYRAFQIRNRLEFLEAKGRELNQHEFRVLELRERGGLFRCTSRQLMDVKIPLWLSRVIQPRLLVTQRELWHPPTADGSRRHDIVIEIANAPITIRGRGLLSPEDWVHSRYELSMQVVSHRRLIGPRVERIAAEEIEATIVGERDFAIDWISRLPKQRVWPR